MTMIKEVNDTVYKVIGACMEVHRLVGPGYPPEFYTRALEIEFQEKEIPFERNRTVPVKYKEVEIGIASVDFLIAESLLLNVRSQLEIPDIEVQQMLRVMSLLDIPMGLIMNFGHVKIQYKRVLPPRRGEQPLTNKITVPLGYREISKTREGNPLI